MTYFSSNVNSSKSGHLNCAHKPFKAIHIESANNGVVDAISRFQMDRFRSLVPAANRLPGEIPQALTLILSIQLNNF
jgi:hypothetical protein